MGERCDVIKTSSEKFFFGMEAERSQSGEVKSAERGRAAARRRSKSPSVESRSERSASPKARSAPQSKSFFDTLRRRISRHPIVAKYLAQAEEADDDSASDDTLEVALARAATKIRRKTGRGLPLDRLTPDVARAFFARIARGTPGGLRALYK